MGFNKSVIVVEDVAEADFWTPITNTNNTEGFVYIGVARATAVGKANATLAVVKFRGMSEGYANLSIQNAELSDENGNVIIPELISQGSIQVIPEFSSVLITLPLAIAALGVAAVC